MMKDNKRMGTINREDSKGEKNGTEYTQENDTVRRTVQKMDKWSAQKGNREC